MMKKFLGILVAALLWSNFVYAGWFSKELYIDCYYTEGQSGYLWYLKAEGDTRQRFEDNLEMSMVEGELASIAGGVDSELGTGGSADTAGTQGLFAAITA